MLEPRIEEDNVININEETLSIISERHRNIILSFKKDHHLLATVCVFIANLIDFSKPLGINNFSIQGGKNERIN
tara:strand:- start:730 stop:951 length:222 start_codon:yes stop_codon:yes gene_type:complete